jgi:hypothetical protein
VTSQVTMEDGTRHELLAHLHDAHQKGTRGLTEDYLRNLHHTLHQRSRSDPEHTHPGEQSEDAAANAG